MMKLKAFAIACILCIGAPLLMAQVQNPGIQRSGSVTTNNCVAWGPGLGQVHDAGTTCGGGGGVTSVFGRTGVVVAATNDYSFSQIAGSIVGSQLPNPAAAVLGGTFSLAAVTHNFLTSITTGGQPVAAQPACADLSNAAASCATDATNASNISSGTLAGARLPNPAAAVLGGTFSLVAVTHNFLTSITTGGQPVAAQPACADLSNAAASCATDATNASNIGSGTLADGRLSANVPLLNSTNAFTAGNSFSGVTTWTGALKVQMRTVTAAGAITVSATTDYFICVNKASGAATTVNLPGSPGTGLTYLIKDCKGDAATNNITITPAAGNIDNAGTYVISINLGSVAVTYNGTGWFVN